MTLSLYVHSLRYLKPVQVYWRLALVWPRRFDGRLRGVPRFRSLALADTVGKHEAWSGKDFDFLNRVVRFEEEINWNAPGLAKLWIYNLHYFDWINQAAVDPAAAEGLMRDWVVRNPPGVGNGWEPYPLSLRLVNWAKFLARRKASGGGIPQDLFDSLFLQGRYLFGRLEYHLLGNHLLKNAVALLFAGACFEDAEAGRWYRRGRDILLAQLSEQILPDGGHFERSVMYHAIALEDVLDCLNLIRAVGSDDKVLADHLVATAGDMLQFLADVLHPDGEIPLFNDAGIGIAPASRDLFAYAGRLGLVVPRQATAPVTAKADFGLYVLRRGEATLLFDAGPIGPDYLPGHAHCDTLSFELSLGIERWIVNAGTFSYTGPERARYRGTAGHNTVMVDGAEQHEIWASFRVARRGYPLDVALIGERGIRAAHTGYRRLPGSPVHRREIRWEGQSFVVSDRIEGQGLHRAFSSVHLHPEVAVEAVGDREVACRRAGRVLRILSDGPPIRIEAYDYAPGFGLKIPARRLILESAGPVPLTMGFRVLLP